MNNIITTDNGPFNPSLKMSSLEIAELMDKNHRDVMRDIRNLIEQEAITERNFALSEYKDASGKMNPMYLLDFQATMLVITGYDAKRRSLVIDRWMKLETGEAVPMIGGISPAALEELVQRVVAIARPMLQTSGRFVETASVNDYLAWLPHVLQKDSFSTKFDLYDTYVLYCSEAGRLPDPVSLFFTKLYRCRPTLKNARIQVDGKRTPVVVGISIQIGLEA